MSGQKKRTYKTYRELRSQGAESTRKKTAARQEQDFVSWIHDLGATLQKARHATNISEEEFAKRLGHEQQDLLDLDTSFSDRVQIGHIKAFIDACDASIEIIVHDRNGNFVSERSIASASTSATKGELAPIKSFDPAQIDDLASLVVAKIAERLTMALSRTASKQLKQEDEPPHFLHEDPAEWDDTEKGPDSNR